MARNIEGRFNGAGRSFAIVLGRFNALFTEQLLEGCLDGLRRHGVDEDRIDVVRVPGAWEIPLVCSRVARSGRYRAVHCQVYWNAAIRLSDDSGCWLPARHWEAGSRKFF